MSNADAVGLLGAFTGVAALVWNIYRAAREGPVLKLRLNQGMRWYQPPAGFLGNREYALLNVANVGTQPTTVTHLVGTRYARPWHRLLRRKPIRHWVVMNPAPGTIPAKLAPGEEWSGSIEQSEVDHELVAAGHFYVGVYHTFGERPKMIRVKEKDKRFQPPKETIGGEPPKTA